jgi:predicted MFS family arabinose efflux permease
VVAGGSIALGALISGGLILWDPLTGHSALLLPLLCWAGLNVVHLIAVVVLMDEPPRDGDGSMLARALSSTREAPRVIRDGLGLLRHNRVLLTVVLVEVFMTIGLVVFEIFQPIRLAELVGGEEQAGALMGPVAAVGWGVFAVGSALAGFASGRIGVARTAILARVLNGLGAVTMGLVAGPAALVAAYLFTYALHGTGGPMHQTLLHREALARNRATVLSINSMVFFVTFAVVSPPLGLLAESATTQAAMVTAGAISVLGALLYLPALRAERRRADVHD